MAKKNGRNWQNLGFRNFADFLRFQRDKKLANILYASLKACDERHAQEAADREKYHQMRLRYLADGTHNL